MSDKWYLFLDDARKLSERSYGPDDEEWVQCRTSREAYDLIMERGMPNGISFDYDLSYPNGYDKPYCDFQNDATYLVTWLSSAIRHDKLVIPDDFQWWVHSTHDKAPTLKKMLENLFERKRR